MSHISQRPSRTSCGMRYRAALHPETGRECNGSGDPKKESGLSAAFPTILQGPPDLHLGRLTPPTTWITPLDRFYRARARDLGARWEHPSAGLCSPAREKHLARDHRAPLFMAQGNSEEVARNHLKPFAQGGSRESRRPSRRLERHRRHMPPALPATGYASASKSLNRLLEQPQRAGCSEGHDGQVDTEGEQAGAVLAQHRVHGRCVARSSPGSRHKHPVRKWPQHDPHVSNSGRNEHVRERYHPVTSGEDPAERGLYFRAAIEQPSALLV